jgi:hypothetical protein
LSDSVVVRSELFLGSEAGLEFAVAKPTGDMTFTAASLRQDVSIAVVLRRLKTFNATMLFTFRSLVYRFPLVVVPSVNIAIIPSFPSRVVAGPWNSVQFLVNETIVPTDSRVIELRFDFSGCSPAIATVNSEVLRWSRQIYAPILVTAVGLQPFTTCTLTLRPVSSLAPPELAPTYFTGAFAIRPQPSVQVGINASVMTRDDEIKGPKRWSTNRNPCQVG